MTHQLKTDRANPRAIVVACSCGWTAPEPDVDSEEEIIRAFRPHARTVLEEARASRKESAS